MVSPHSILYSLMITTDLLLLLEIFSFLACNDATFFSYSLTSP